MRKRWQERHFCTLDQIASEEKDWWHFDPLLPTTDYRSVGNIKDCVGQHWENLVKFAYDMDLSVKDNSVFDFASFQKNDQETIRNVTLIRNMGYDEQSSSQYKTFSDIFPEIFAPILDACGLLNPIGSMIHQKPGRVTPWHYDIFAFYAKQFNIAEQDRPNITRLVVFLDDWSWGHYFLVGNSVVHQWRGGDMITWPYRMRHLSANAGLSPKLTLQVTGMITPKSAETQLASSDLSRNNGV